MFLLILIINIVHLFLRYTAFGTYTYHGGGEEYYINFQKQFKKEVTDKIGAIENKNDKITEDFYKFLNLYIKYSDLSEDDKETFKNKIIQKSL